MTVYHWGLPGASKKFHIFCGMRSLCGKWLYAGADQQVDEVAQTANKDDCCLCVKRWNAMLTTKTKKGK